MPLLEITTSNDLFESVREKILREASAAIAQSLGKSESSVMVTIKSAHNLFGGESGPSAFIELRSTGSLDSQTATRIAQSLCQLMETEADVPAERVYLNFVEVKRKNWAWNGRLLS